MVGQESVTMLSPSGRRGGGGHINASEQNHGKGGLSNDALRLIMTRLIIELPVVVGWFALFTDTLG